MKRAEPMVAISMIYKEKNMLRLAYEFANIACELDEPECILFVNKIAYDYTRWHLLGLTAFYNGEMEKGRRACEKALLFAGQDIDRFNFQFYPS
jgi:hypothetical protein